MDHGQVEEAHRFADALICDATEARITGIACLIEGAWSIVHAVITTLHPGMPRPRSFEIEESGVLAFEKHASQGDLQEFLASVLRGRPILPDSCRAGHLSGPVQVTAPNFKQREYAARDFGVDWPCAYLEMNGGGLQAPDLHQRFQRFLARLPTKDPPFLDPRKLGKRLGIQGDLTIERGSFLTVRCPLPLRLGPVRPTGDHGALHIQVEAYGRTADHFVTSACPTAPSHDGVTVPRDAFTSEPSPSGLFSATVAIGAHGPITLSLFTQDTQHGVVDSLVAGLPHAPFVVHEHFDQKCAMLKQLLFGEGEAQRNDPSDFAAGVSWLLHLVGFAAMSLGLRSNKKNLTHSPDIIARSTDGRVIIVGECSLTLPTDEKAGKLLSRARSVEAALRAEGALSKAGLLYSTRIVPVFFTAASGNQEDDSVHLLQKHDLEELLRLAEFGGDPSGILLP